MSDAAGERLTSALSGHYTIERELGQSGMATAIAQPLDPRVIA
ncbi:MAG TPA: hypothetical protein VGQ52_06715 [Gemmatimonadaceae bacterium]|nr:hypothetical protein [Gemmatimonadaceae bacterium]